MWRGTRSACTSGTIRPKAAGLQRRAGLRRRNRANKPSKRNQIHGIGGKKKRPIRYGFLFRFYRQDLADIYKVQVEFVCFPFNRGYLGTSGFRDDSDSPDLPLTIAHPLHIGYLSRPVVNGCSQCAERMTISCRSPGWIAGRGWRSGHYLGSLEYPFCLGKYRTSPFVSIADDACDNSCLMPHPTPLLTIPRYLQSRT